MARPNETVSAGFLIDAVWAGAIQSNPKSSLQVTVNRLRHHLEPDADGKWTVVVSEGDGYRLVADELTFDVLQFESMTSDARTARQGGDARTAVERYQGALDLWRGPAFGDFAHESAVRTEAVRLEEAKLVAEDEQADLLLGLGRDAELIPTLTERIDSTPFRERRWAQLMLALYRSNRQGDALRAFQRLRVTVGEELGIEPSHDLRQLEEAILLQDPKLELRRADSAPPLPGFPNHFVGRGDELDHMKRLLDKNRLLTIVGIGGLGKTRTAIELARRTAEEYANGVIYINLAELIGDLQLGDYVVSRLQASPGRDRAEGEVVEVIIDLLRNRHTLLVMDNAEELAKSVSRLIDVIAETCPQVSIVATSRIPLRHRGEMVWNLPPMRHASPTGDAAALLSERSGVAVSETNQAELLEICELTGGIPLGLELAASILTTTPASAVIDRLKKNLASLNRATEASDLPPMQVITRWSLDRLDQSGMKTISGLSVFRGGFDAEAARAVVSTALGIDDDEVSKQLHYLVELGLVRFVDGRYSMLEPVRQVVDADLDENSMNSLTDSHIAFFAKLSMKARESFEFVSTDQENWYRRLAADRANFGVMLERGLERLDTKVLDAIPGLALYWSRRGEVREGSEWIGRALDRFDPIGDDHIETLLFGAHVAMWDSDAETADQRLTAFEKRLSSLGTGPSPLSIRAKHSRGNLTGWGFGRPADSIDHFMESVDLSRQIHYPAGLVSLLSAAYMAVRTGHNDRARELIEHVPEMAQMMSIVTGLDGVAFADLGTDQIMGLIGLYEGDLKSAEELMYSSVEGAMAVGIAAIAGPLLVPAGWASLLSGSVQRAEETASRALRFVQDEAAGWRSAEPFCLLGGVALEQENMEASARWFTRALVAASRAPELDLVVWSLAGLAGHDVIKGESAEASHFLSHMESIADEISLVLPEPLVERFDLVDIDPTPCDRIGSPYELEHVVTSAKFDSHLDWKDIL